MSQDDLRDEEKKEPEAEIPREAGDEAEQAGDEKTAVRKKPADTREHREHKDARDHQKIKALRGEIEDLKKALDDREKEVKTARSEAGEARDKMLRSLADADNFRKRVEREKTEYLQYALADVLKDILHVIDNLERAMKAHDAPDGYREGIELIWKQMSDLVIKRGVTPIPDTGGKFDPSFHHALSTEEADGIDEPLIGEMLQQGYMLNDRLLRPALVKVLVPKRD